MSLQTSLKFDPRKPFSRADARAAGITLRELLGPRFQRVFFDVYLSAAVRLATPERARAALAVCPPGSFVSHHTAATLWGACVPATEHIHVSIPVNDRRPERRGIQSHRASHGEMPTEHRGIPLSTPAQCFLEMARAGTNLVDLVVLGDSLVKAGCITLEHLRNVSSGWIGCGAKSARRAVKLVRNGVDSSMESRLRMLLVLAGLPEPEVNRIIRDDNGEWLMRFDLSYGHLKLVIEYDGRQHGDDAGQWKRDTRRREVLDRQGWRMVVVHAEDIYSEPQETLDRIRQILLELGQPGLRKRYSPEWSRYFPVRSVG